MRSHPRCAVSRPACPPQLCRLLLLDLGALLEAFTAESHLAATSRSTTKSVGRLATPYNEKVAVCLAAPGGAKGARISGV